MERKKGVCAAVFHFISHPVYQKKSTFQSHENMDMSAATNTHMFLQHPALQKVVRQDAEPILRSRKHFKQYVIR